MKAKLILVISAALLVTVTQAQTTLKPATNTTTNTAVTAVKAPTPVSAGGIGSLIAKLAKNISPDAKTPEFVKYERGWLQKAEMTTDVRGGAWLLNSLQNGLKTTAFNAEWNKQINEWKVASSNLKTVKDVAGQLDVLSANINPSVMQPSWNKESANFKAGLNSMK